MAFQLSKLMRPFAAISVAASLLAGIVAMPSQAEAGECYKRTAVSLSYGEAAINNIDHRLDSNGMDAGFCLSKDKKKILLGSWYAPDQRFVQHTVQHHVKPWVKRMEARHFRVRGLPLIDKNDKSLLAVSVDGPLELHPHVKQNHFRNNRMMAAAHRKPALTMVATAHPRHKHPVTVARAGTPKPAHTASAFKDTATKVAAKPHVYQESAPVRDQVGAQWVQNAGTQISYNITIFFDGLKL